jgi:hypothetical protein
MGKKERIVLHDMYPFNAVGCGSMLRYGGSLFASLVAYESSKCDRFSH